MTTATIKSQTSNAEYTLYFNSKKQAIACSCPSRRFNPSNACKHMNAHNSELESQKQAKQDAKDAERTAYNNFALSMGF